MKKVELQMCNTCNRIYSVITIRLETKNFYTRFLRDHCGHKSHYITEIFKEE